MNFLTVTKKGDTMLFGDGQSAAVPASLNGHADGSYMAGFRPNHVELSPRSAGSLSFETRLAVTEITGSETFVHLDHHGERWVGLVHGVQSLEPGQGLTVYLDPDHVYIFGTNGDLVATAPYAEAA